MGVVIKQSIKGTIVTYIGVAIGAFTTLVILTRFLTTEEVGLTRVLIEAATLLSSLAQLGTSSSILRFYPFFKDSEKKDNGFFFWTVIIPLVGFMIFGLTYIILRTPITNYFSEKSQLFNNYFYFIVPLAFCLMYMTVFETNANVLMRIVVPKFVREILVRILSLTVYLLFAFKIISIDGMVVGLCLVYAVAMLIDLGYLLSLGKISLKPDFKFITKSLRHDYTMYTIMLVIASIATVITPFLNTFFITAKMGLSSTGIYAIAVFIATLVEIPYRSLGAISQPLISQSVKDGNIAETNKLCQNVSLHQLLAGCFIFFIIWINIDVLFDILPNGDIYKTGKMAVLILGFAKLVYSTMNIGITTLNFSKYYYFSFIFTTIMTISAILLNIRLIPVYGINGAAMATLLSYVIYYILMILFDRLKLKVSLFSAGHLKTLAIVAVMIIFNMLWTYLISNKILTSSASIWTVLADAVVKTIIIVSTGLFILYRWKVSDSVNNILNKILRINRQ